MPIYEYQCTACGHQLDALQKISEAPLSDCPECHKSALQKLVSAAAFQLKGTGWYATDYKAKPKPASDSNSESTKTADTKSTDTKSTDTAASS